MESLHSPRGFTIIELLGVFAIISVIMGVVFTGQNSFNKTLVLANTAYDIALSLRSVENYGLGGRLAGGVTNNTGYGIHFDRTIPGVFTLFADIYPPVGSASGLCHPPPSYDATGPDALPGDCTYSSVNDKSIVTYTLGNGITVNDFCVKSASTGVWSCASASGLVALDIVFTRPIPNPSIRSDGLPYTAACLAITSPQGGARYVSIAASGSINANAASCP